MGRLHIFAVFQGTMVKFCIMLLLQSVADSLVTPELLQVQPIFEQWKFKFGVVCCQSEEEYVYRLGVFAAVDAEIKAHNRANNTWMMGHNAMSHMTLDEIRQSRGQIPNLKEHAKCPLTHDAPEAGVQSLPDAVDWRGSGAVTPVKNQGGCGSCWSFSSTGSLEGAFFKKYGKQPSPNGFSEQNLVDCVDGGGGCGGGRQDNAFQWMKGNGGLCSEVDYPYEGTNGQCRTSTCTVVDGSDVVDCVGVVNTEAALQSAVAQQPVSVVVNGDPFARFSGGVITSGCSSQPDHAVLVVGYGTDESIDCDVPPAKGCPYWIVKDSYGADHAENGYVKVQRGGWPAQWGGMCGILIMPLYPVLGNTSTVV